MDRSFRKNFIVKSIVIVVLWIFPLSAGNDEELFLRGNRYYEQHDYDNALQSYSMMGNKGRAVLYNMGNCFFQKQEYAQALVFWLRSEKGATLHEFKSIMHNTQSVLKKLGLARDEAFCEYLKNRLNIIAFSFSLFFLQIFFLMCWFLFFYLLRKRKNFVLKSIFALVTIFIVGDALFLGIYCRKNSLLEAIVVKKNSLLFSGPDKGFHPISPVAYGRQITVKEARQGWYKIQYTDIIGWIEADMIEII